MAEMHSCQYRVWDTGHQAFVDHILIAQDGRLLLNLGGLLVPSIEPERYIVERATGRKDKKGTLLFEGDIFFDDNLHIWPKGRRTVRADKLVTRPLQPILVEWNESQAGYDPWASVDYESTEGYASDEIERAGNIHENPELLNN